MNEKIDIDIDAAIKALLEVRSCKPGKMVKLDESVILGIIRTVKNIFMNQPMLV